MYGYININIIIITLEYKIWLYIMLIELRFCGIIIVIYNK